MTFNDERLRYASVTAVARVFVLLILAPPVAFSATNEMVLNLALLASVWLGSVFLDLASRIPVVSALVVEASLVTFLVALTLGDSGVLLPALVVPVFVGGLVRGTRGVVETLFAEVVILLAAILPNPRIDRTVDLAVVLFTWLMVSLGIGLVAALVHRARQETPGRAASYRDARALITRLLDLSGELVDGLDPVSIADNISLLTREEVPLVGCVVYVPTDDGFTPLVEGGEHTDSHREALLRVVSVSPRPAKAESEVAFPLLTDAGLVGIVIGHLNPADRASESASLESALAALVDRLRPQALQLDTALLFAQVRNEATREERRRLAREMHDGVSQDLASLGYLVDDLIATADTPTSRESCVTLRAELTKVVAELRRSVFSLRNDDSGSLGASLTALARHIEARTDIVFDVKVDEDKARLRPEVESELVRIAQEGMNNASRHAQARHVQVTCRVDPPYAMVSVEDDGRGLQPGREDSHGIRIMRERAQRIGASFDLSTRPDGTGVRLVVELPRQGRTTAVEHRREGVSP